MSETSDYHSRDDPTRGAALQLAPLAFDLCDQSFFVLCWQIAGGKNKRIIGAIT